MAKYRVSYQVLRKQGEDMKAVAKMVDGYAEKVGKIRGKLGSDNMLAEIRNNLQKLSAQLLESRAVINTAGELLVKNVEDYGSAETRQVSKIDAMKAHSRDFYKRPVAVASAGGGRGSGGGGGATISSGASSGSAGASSGGAGLSGGSAPEPATTVNYTDNSVNVTYNAEPANYASQSMPDVAAVSAGSANAASSPRAVASESAAPQSVSAQPAAGAPARNAAIIGGSALGGAVVASGAVFGGMELKKRNANNPRSRDSAEADDEPESDGYDPEAELANAIQRVRELENEGAAAEKG